MLPLPFRDMSVVPEWLDHKTSGTLTMTSAVSSGLRHFLSAWLMERTLTRRDARQGHAEESAPANWRLDESIDDSELARSPADLVSVLMDSAVSRGVYSGAQVHGAIWHLGGTIWARVPAEVRWRQLMTTVCGRQHAEAMYFFDCARASTHAHARTHAQRTQAHTCARALCSC